MSEDLYVTLEHVEEAYQREDLAKAKNGSLSKEKAKDILAEPENYMEPQASEIARLIGVSDAGMDKDLKSTLCLLIKRR